MLAVGLVACEGPSVLRLSRGAFLASRSDFCARASRRARVQAAQLRQPSHTIGKALHPNLRLRAHDTYAVHQPAAHVIAVNDQSLTPLLVPTFSVSCSALRMRDE